MDAMRNDDFHHTAMVALTGRNEAYYTDYRGSAQEFVSVAKYG
jgi:maltooligosyltrehalose trehalohydrolase